MIGTPFQFTQYQQISTTMADVGNGAIFFPAMPIPQDVSVNTYYYLWSINIGCRITSSPEIWFEPWRYFVGFSGFDAINSIAGGPVGRIDFFGNNHNFYNYYRFKLDPNGSYLFQAGLNINGTAVAAFQTITMSATVVLTYEPPINEQESPGQKRDWQIQPGQKNPLQGKPGRFQFK